MRLIRHFFYFLFFVPFVIGCTNILGNSVDSAIQTSLKYSDTVSKTVGKTVASARDSVMTEGTKKYVYSLTDSTSKIVFNNAMVFVDSVEKRVLELPDSLSTKERLQDYDKIREQFTGSNLNRDMIVLRDSLLGDESFYKINRLIDSIYGKSLNKKIDTQRENIVGDAREIIIISGIIIFLCILGIGGIYIYSLRLKKSLQVVTDVIDDMAEGSAKKELKKEIKMFGKKYKVHRYIDDAVSVRIIEEK